MTFTEMLQALVGAPHLVGFRPPRRTYLTPKPIIGLTRRGHIQDLSGPKPRAYLGVMDDYCAIDWIVIKSEDLAAKMAEQMALMKAAEPDE